MAAIFRRRVNNIFEVPRDILADFIGRGLFINRHHIGLPVQLEVAPGRGLFLDDQRGGLISILVGDGIDFDNRGRVNINCHRGLRCRNGRLEMFLGDGLDLGNDHQVNVVTGAGLHIDNENSVAVRLADGLEVNNANRISINVGEGLKVNHNNKLNVNLGDGLALGQNNKINVHVGSGLFIDNGKVCVDVGSGLTFNNNKIDVVIDAAIDSSKDSAFAVQTGSSLTLDGRKLTLTKQMTNFIVRRNAAGFVVEIAQGATTESKDEVILVDGGYGYFEAFSAPKDFINRTSPNFYKK